jgi:tRNA wybutosine-synthesizing protein 1
MAKIDSSCLKKFINAKYGIAGRHSAVQICSWSIKAIRGRGVCYKQKFYGIDCHRCAQMSPAFAWCHQSCVHCWRPAEWMKKVKFSSAEVDAPGLIIEEVVKKRKKLVSGIGGAADANLQLAKQSIHAFPSHWAISLSGEPTIYPKLAEMIKELRQHREVRSIFLVTNGQEPARIAQLSRKRCLPTQLYVSISAPNKEQFKKLNKSTYKDGWKRLLRTLGMLRRLSCRTVIRLTLMKGINDSKEAATEFAKIFEKAAADFIEVKSYMFLGESRKRLKKENMPEHEDVRRFSKLLLKQLPSYRWDDEDKRSQIILFKRNKSKVPNLIRSVKGK